MCLLSAVGRGPIDSFENDRSALPASLHEYRDVFNTDSEAARQLVTQASHPIVLELGTKPPFRPLYNLSTTELATLREYLELAMEKGWIRRSESEAGAPILFVPKKDGTLRLCVDYRGLNSITVKNRCPLPLIGETLDRLSGAQIFTKLDLKDAYHRIPIKRGDEWKTAFRTRYGHFEYMVMPFGLTNAPATFQSYINQALSGLLDQFCVVYLDDILIYSDTIEEHTKHVRLVLERLRKHALYASQKKCEFFVDKVEFLGFIVSNVGVSMDPRRVATIEEWPSPTSFQELQQFLGFANFYRRFIQAYSQKARPLTALLKGSIQGKKPGPFLWNADAEAAMRTLRTAFTEAPVLRHYDPALQIKVETDASKYACAAIASQLCTVDGQWHPIAFWSRKFIAAEINYETHDQELLAIVEAFRHWRHYLEGASHAVRVLTDHNNLRGFMGVKQLNGRQARWATFLAAFDFTIEHRPSKGNPADAPSRRPDYVPEAQDLSNLLPTLQAKLQTWNGRGVDDPLVRRIRATGEQALGSVHSPIEGALPIRLPRAAAIAMLSAEDVYQTPSQGALELIRVLQKTDRFSQNCLSPTGRNRSVRDSH